MLTTRQAAQLALQAYTDKPTLGSESSAGRAVVYGTAVGFPGTDNLACWLADLDAATVQVPGLGLLHAGFWRAYQGLAGHLMGLQGVEVALGHSEGAALALLYAGQLCLAGRPPKAVYAFEPPRPSADAVLGKLLAQNGVKVVLTRKGNDVVPLVPRLIHPWQLPGQLTAIGHACEPIPNVQDHFIAGVLAALP